MRRLVSRTAAALASAALCVASPAAADSLTITKTASVISDPLGYTLTPRSLPGAIVDYKILYQNPSSNYLKPVRNIVTEDFLPANVIMRVTDVGAAGKGPLEFLDGSLLGTGLLGSGLTYTYTSLASQSDGLDFWNGTNWGYVPQPDAQGYDPNVRGFRMTTGTGLTSFATGTSFQIRYRVKIR